MKKFLAIAIIIIAVVLILALYPSDTTTPPPPGPGDPPPPAGGPPPPPGSKPPPSAKQPPPPSKQPPPPAARGNFPTGPTGNSKILEPGWTDPIKLGFNTDGWYDSPFIKRDGSQILFFWHSISNLGDPKVFEKLTEELVADPEKGIRDGKDGKIYVSNRPFTSKSIHPISQNKGGLAYSDACPYISESGDLFHCSTKESWVRGKGVNPTMYLNGKRLDFGTGDEEGNGHFVDSLDEKWFDCPGDKNICIMENAKANNFKGKVKLAPAPINHSNSNIIDFQPYLTDDGQTLYFSSTRGGNDNIAIYKTTRNGNSWSTPTKFIENPGGGAAEISMTADGKELIYAELFFRNDDSPGLHIYYSRKK